MGLDMYLERDVFVGAQYNYRNVTGQIQLSAEGKTLDIDLKKVSIISEQFACWRKANAIHAWFVQNVQNGNDDCKRYYVEREQLSSLLILVNKVLDSIVIVNGVVYNGTIYENGTSRDQYKSGKVVDNPEVARCLLPTKSGFFFGNTDYDEYYIDDLKYTKKVLEEAISCETGTFYYQSSW